ncbi:MAG: hypothetical protein GEV07_14670 [Streptosporangiales bacterium]|nr:hypothetical protein [Streptosporangiales bacterium]
MRAFGELEAAVMNRLWSLRRPASVREVLDALREDRDLAYTTVLTVMDKLHKKGWLRRESAGRAHLYEPVASRDAYTARLMRSALSTSPNHAATFVHFLAELTPEESEALRAALSIVPPEGRASDRLDRARRLRTRSGGRWPENPDQVALDGSRASPSHRHVAGRYGIGAGSRAAGGVAGPLCGHRSTLGRDDWVGHRVRALCVDGHPSRPRLRGRRPGTSSAREHVGADRLP